MSKFDGEAFGLQMVEVIKEYVKPLRDALDAAKAENDALRSRIEQIEARAPVPGPEGKDGRDGVDGKDGAPGLDGKDGAPGLNGKDGRDGIDGKDGAPGLNGKDGRDGIDGKDGAPGLNGKDGRDGIDGKDGGSGISGKDGAPGRDGQPGVPGRDGKDGLGFEDLDIEHDGARQFTFRMARGERVKEFVFSLPIVIDQGVWKERQYSQGDGVTWRGSFWIAQRDTSTKPDEANSDWRLAVKRGRDGKDATRREGASY